jgi:putative sterol carrier protein
MAGFVANGRVAMGYPFPSEEWLLALKDVLNRDPRYAQVAAHWEGDMVVVIELDHETSQAEGSQVFYLDLWHGRCREARLIQHGEEIPDAKFVLKAKIDHIMRIFQGDLDPMQAMLTRRLHVQGDMAYMLRNVPTVLDFVRCCRQVEIDTEEAPA